MIWLATQGAYSFDRSYIDHNHLSDRHLLFGVIVFDRTDDNIDINESFRSISKEPNGLNCVHLTKKSDQSINTKCSVTVCGIYVYVCVCVNVCLHM